MEFAYTEEQEAFRRELRDWLEENLPERWQRGDRRLPEDEFERREFLRDWQRTLDEGDWVGIHWSEAYGGRGASVMEQTIYREEMARIDAPPLINGVAVDFVGPTIVAAGTERQKERFLPTILGAEEIWCQGFSEPEAGSDVASLATRAEKDGDEWIINGRKIWTSGAHYADWCFLVARTDFSGSKHEGITTLLVEMDQAGITTERIRQISGNRHFNQVYFDDAIAEEEHVVGEVGGGWDVVMTLSAFEHASTEVFALERRYLDLLEHCRSETRNGEPLIEDPGIRRRLADVDARIHAAKASHYRTVSKRNAEGRPGPEGSMDQLVSDEIRLALANLAVDVRGPGAALWEDDSTDSGWGSGYPGAYGTWIAAGTGDVQRNIIGERVLDLPKDDKSETSHRRT